LPEGASPAFRDKINNIIGNCIDAEGDDRTVRWNGQSVKAPSGAITRLDRGPGED
jgi:hypothetical protein